MKTCTEIFKKKIFKIFKKNVRYIVVKREIKLFFYKNCDL